MVNKKIFGPIPSRRLGRSIGINNIPPKNCSYSCVYCQVGKAINITDKRKRFYEPSIIVKETNEFVKEVKKKGLKIDYLTFVSEGEPTLDINLGKEIRLLKKKNDIKIAVITNASMLSYEGVKTDLYEADLVSIKLDSLKKEIWKKINRPFPKLELEKILKEIIKFSKYYKGKLITETMLVEGLNDNLDDANKIGIFLKKISPIKAFISIPTRPPACSWVKPPDKKKFNLFFEKVKKEFTATESLTGYEGDDFGGRGKITEEILSITSVHPLRKSAIEQFLKRSGSKWSLIERLVDEGLIKKTEYNGEEYYRKKIK